MQEVRCTCELCSFLETQREMHPNTLEWPGFEYLPDVAAARWEPLGGTQQPAVARQQGPSPPPGRLLAAEASLLKA